MSIKDEVPVWGPWSNKPGPIHRTNTAYPDLAWCGAKMQYRHRRFSAPLGEVTCPKCLAAIRQDRPRSWRRR